MKKLRITVDGITYEVEVEILEDSDAGANYGYGAHDVFNQPPVSAPLPPPPPVSTRPVGPSTRSSKTLTSPLPGIVKDIKVKVGDTVKENTPVIVLEAMKMETIISSPVDAVIKEIKVQTSQNVQQGEVLVEFV